jgi:hypothetical protein
LSDESHVFDDFLMLQPCRVGRKIFRTYGCPRRDCRWRRLRPRARAQERTTQRALRAHFAAAGVEPHYAAEAWFAQKCNHRRHAPPLLAEKLRRAAGVWGDATLVAARACGIDVQRVHLGLGLPRSVSAEQPAHFPRVGWAADEGDDQEPDLARAPAGSAHWRSEEGRQRDATGGTFGGITADLISAK